MLIESRAASRRCTAAVNWELRRHDPSIYGQGERAKLTGTHVESLHELGELPEPQAGADIQIL